MVPEPAGPGRTDALSLDDLARLPIARRAERLLLDGRDVVGATLAALRDGEGGGALRLVDEDRIAWALAYNVDGSLPFENAPHRSIRCYCDRWPRTTAWSAVWTAFTRAPARDHAGPASSLLAELASSVACEHRDDWQNPPSRPVDTSIANQAFEWVYRRNRLKVLGDVHRSFGTRAGEPEAIAQEAWARVFCEYWSASARRRFLGLARVSTLVCQVARHVAVDVLRAGAHDVPVEDAGLDDEFPRRAPRLDEVGLDDDPDSQILSDQLTARIRECLTHLPPRTRLVAELIWFREVQARRVAEILGISEPAVSQHLKRARLAVRESLAPAFASSKRVNPEPGRATD